MIDDFFARAHELVRKGEAFVTATVVRAEKPSSGKPGDRAIITADGVMHGWIGGSCAQPTVVKEAMKALSDGETRFLRLSAEPASHGAREGLIDLPMTCFSGGTLEIYIEPQPPRPRLLIVGTLPVARSLARLGAAMNYHVIMVDLDHPGDHAGDLAADHAGDRAADPSGECPPLSLPYADETLAGLEDIAAQIRPSTFVIVATHGMYDELALETILPARPDYVGLVASPRRASAVRDLLVERGVTPAQLEPLKAPAGLDIQARRGDEIALSIMAEIVQRRRRAEPFEPARSDAIPGGPDDQALRPDVRPGERAERPDVMPGTDGADAAVDVEAHGGEASTAETAIDPVCGMEVHGTRARHTHEYEGQTYYFCCPGCQSRFAREPELYLE